MNSQNNFNVLCSIGSSLVTNTQLNNFPNSGTFGVGSNVATNMGNSTAGGSVTIYTTTTTTSNDQQNVSGTSTGEVGGAVGITGGPLQEIIVNPTSMVGWRLSANGSLIPPPDILTSGLPTAAAQKRGSERLFQYLEADGSDPEDYSRLLKMDAISRNTASVAQDFHKAGGVQELKIPANHQLLINNRLLTQITTDEAAALLASLRNNNNNNNHYGQVQQQMYNTNHHYQQQQARQRNHSTGEDDENTPSSASSTTSNEGEMSSSSSSSSSSISPTTTKGINTSIEQRKAMLSFLGNNFNLKETKIKSDIIYNNIMNNNNHNTNQDYMDENQENQEQLIESPPAPNLKYNNKKITNQQNNKNNNIFNKNSNNTNNNNNNNKKFRLDLYKDNKENKVVSATIDSSNMAAQVAANYLTALEYQNMNSHKIGTQLENYIKEIINKYYATNDITASMFYAQQQQQEHQQQQQPYNMTQIDKQLEQPPQQHQENTIRKRILSETEGYIEYLKNKSDITLTITPKIPSSTTITTTSSSSNRSSQQFKNNSPPLKRETVDIIPTTCHNNNNTNKKRIKRKSITQIATLLPLLADAASKQQYLSTPIDFSKKTTTTLNDETTITTIPKTPPTSKIDYKKNINFIANGNKRKQAQPKKKGRPSPQIIVARLRDKYLNRLVKRKLKCHICAEKRKNCHMVFNYHSKATLTLHHLWKHPKNH